MDDARSKFIYEQLNTFKLGSSPASSIQPLQDNVNIESVNEKAMETYNLINKATFRTDSGAIPETMVIGIGNTTDSGVGVNIFTPAKGEVWGLQSGSTVVSGRSGNVTHELYWVDNVSSREMKWYLLSSGLNTTILSDDENWKGDKFIDSNITLKYEATGTFTDSVISILLYRVR